MLNRFLIGLYAFSLVGATNGLAFARPPACQGGYSPRFVISGEVQNSTTYDEESLRGSFVGFAPKSRNQN
jgi:hypothetical protein